MKIALRLFCSGLATAITLTPALSALAADPVSPAADADAAMERTFKAADKNGDGKLTLAEAKAGMPRVASTFTRIDANKDVFGHHRGD